MEKKLRRHKEVRYRHYFFAWFNRLVVANIIRRKYRFKGEVIHKNKKTPQLVLCNHESELDPFLVYYIYKAPLYIVANEQIVTNPKYGFLLKMFMNPLPIKKGTLDINVIRRMKDVIKEGGSIALFPEGNSSYDSQLSFNLHNPGKLAKLLGIELVIYNLKGGYFNNPRWSQYRKKGLTRGKIRLKLSPQQIEVIPLDELEQLIKENLTVDPYENNLGPYKGKMLAVGLERLIFFCPKCHHHHVLATEDNKIFCNNCDFEGMYDEYGYVQIAEQKYKLHDLARPMIDEYEKYVLNHLDETFYEDVEVKISWGLKRRKIYYGCVFSLNSERITIIGKKFDFKIPFEDLRGYGCQQKRKLVFYCYSLPTIIIRLKSNASIYQYFITLRIFEELKKKGVNNYVYLTHRNLGF